MDSVLPQTSPYSIRQTLKQLHRGLCENYTALLGRIDNQKEEYSRLAGQVIRLVSHTVRLLTLKEMQHALAIELETTIFRKEALSPAKLIISVCCGLVVLESDKIRFLHYSAQEYLLTHKEKRLLDAHAVLAKYCLTYLSYDAFSDGPCLTDDDRNERAEAYPFLAYAATHLGTHLTRSRETSSSDRVSLDKLVATFFRQPFLLLNFSQARFVVMMKEKGLSFKCGSSSYYPKRLHGLTLAAEFGMKATLASLLEDGADVNAVDGKLWTALHAAAKNGDEAIINILLERKAHIHTTGQDWNIRDWGEYTPLQLAAKGGYVAAFRLLLKVAVDSGIDAMKGDSALKVAAAAGRRAIVEILLPFASKADLYSALTMAAGGGHEALVLLFLDLDIDFRRTSKDKTPLHQAAFQGRDSIVQLLIDRGMDPNLKGFEEATPLHEAVKGGKEATAALLLKYRASVDARNTHGKTPLIELSSYINGYQMIPRTRLLLLLLDHGADINARTSYGTTTLHWSSYNGNKTAVQLLLARGADVNAMSYSRKGWFWESEVGLGFEALSGETPLHNAAMNGTDCIQPLLDNGATLEALSFNGRTPLHYACRGASKEAVTILLRHGADLKRKDNHGRTALHLAVLSDEGRYPDPEKTLKLVRLLIRHGANPRVKDNYRRWTASRYAGTQPGFELVTQLLAKAEDDFKERMSRDESHVLTSRKRRHSQMADSQPQSFINNKNARYPLRNHTNTRARLLVISDDEDDTRTVKVLTERTLTKK